MSKLFTEVSVGNSIHDKFASEATCNISVKSPSTNFSRCLYMKPTVFHLHLYDWGLSVEERTKSC